MLEHLKIMLGVCPCRNLVTTASPHYNRFFIIIFIFINNKNVEVNSHLPQIFVINFDFVGLFILINIKPHIKTEAVWSSINLLLARQRYKIICLPHVVASGSIIYLEKNGFKCVPFTSDQK